MNMEEGKYEEVFMPYSTTLSIRGQLTDSLNDLRKSSLCRPNCSNCFHSVEIESMVHPRAGFNIPEQDSTSTKVNSRIWSTRSEKVRCCLDYVVED